MTDVEILEALRPFSRIVIAGGPRTGKSTLAVRAAERFGLEYRPGDALVSKGFEWSAASEEISTWFDGIGYVIESVAAARAIRKWLAANTGERPFPAVIVLLSAPIQIQSDGQKAMSKGCETVWREIEPELIKRKTVIFRRDV